MTVYPTNRAAFLAGAAGLAALAIAAAAPGMWAVGLALAAGVVALLAADGAMSPWLSGLGVEAPEKPLLQVGRSAAVAFGVSFQSGGAHGLESRLEADELISVADEGAPHAFRLTPLRRGRCAVARLWVRWRGPLGLVYKQHAVPVDWSFAVSSNTRAIEEDAIKVLLRENAVGAKVQIERGEGTEFEALREFQVGMDARAIDWKQSARHRTLLTKEFRTERNHSIVFAIDTGRLMSAPVMGGVARLDHALNAALMMAFVSIKLGDRAGMFAFDAKPHTMTAIASGARAFQHLKAAATDLDYSAEETNYTLGLTELSSHLDRRALIIIFTDFVDTTSAELMLANMPTLLKKHMVLFVAFRDDEAEAMVGRAPSSSEDISRAVIADGLMRERDLVVSRLQKMGAEIIDAPADRIGVSLINTYLRIKKRGLL
ncbi:MAG: DUF58 domain-containing protein [Pseudomonadota bacterium]